MATETSTKTQSLHVAEIGAVELSYSERGSGHPVMVLHGGGGPMSVVPWAELLGRTRSARVITPTHPGFAGTPRPDTLSSLGGLARVYAAFLDSLNLPGVTVVGNSVGGQIAAELALLRPGGVAGLAIVDGTGIEVPGHPVADAFSMPREELFRRSYHDPVRFAIDPTKLPPPALAAMAANFAALKVYSTSPKDAPLLPRLAGIEVPTVVLWGDSDRIADSDYGRAYAQAIPGASFHLMKDTGHVPQVETPEQLADLVWRFIEEHPTARARGPG
jgi:pimeloyl-ACP methyl ester carboxylesterase